MKNTIFAALAALFFTFSANAQSTADTIMAKYQLLPMPEALTVEKTFPALGSYHLSGSLDSTAGITITRDSVNKGTVWIAGLPEGAFKAYLKKSPATYRILAQKTSTGKQIPEGTLVFDPETKVLNIALGKAFNDADPAGIFALNPNASITTPAADATAGTEVKVKTKSSSSKSKTKLTFYTANKAEQNTTSL
jgi:hypothetical protein